MLVSCERRENNRTVRSPRGESAQAYISPLFYRQLLLRRCRNRLNSLYEVQRKEVLFFEVLNLRTSDFIISHLLYYVYHPIL